MHILECERFLLCKARGIPSDFASKLLSFFFFFPFVCSQEIFSVGFPEVSRSLWIAIDTCIRTLNSTVRVDVGHSTSFKDLLVLLKYTQNNLQSNLCSILIFLVWIRRGEGQEKREQFFVQTCMEVEHNWWEGSNIFSLRKSNRQFREREYTNSQPFQWCKIPNRYSCQLNALYLLNFLTQNRVLLP